jgi:hypothetical protein
VPNTIVEQMTVQKKGKILPSWGIFPNMKAIINKYVYKNTSGNECFEETEYPVSQLSSTVTKYLS